MDLRDFERAGFGKPVPETKASWDKWGERAFSERCIMMAEFHQWVVKTRIELEQDIITSERFITDIEQFARAGFEGAASPADVPLVVLEFAASSLNLLEKKRNMALLDLYYKSNGNWGGHQEHLQVNPGDEAEINDLWEWFLRDREEAKKEKAAK